MRVINPVGVSSLVYDRITEFLTFSIYEETSDAPYDNGERFYEVPSGSRLFVFYLDMGIRRTKYATSPGRVILELPVIGSYPGWPVICPVVLYSNEIGYEARLILPMPMVFPGGAEIFFSFDDDSTGGGVEYWVRGLGFLFT